MSQHTLHGGPGLTWLDPAIHVFVASRK